MNPLNELADLFDKLADEWEREPVAQAAAAPAVKVASNEDRYETPASKLAELVHSATGETLPSDLAERIASDSALLEHVTKLAESGARPNSLGEAVVKEGSAYPVTRQEKIASAWDRWNNSVRNG